MTLAQQKQIAEAVAHILSALFHLIHKDSSFAQNMTAILSALASIANVIIIAHGHESNSGQQAQSVEVAEDSTQVEIDLRKEGELQTPLSA